MAYRPNNTRIRAGFTLAETAVIITVTAVVVALLLPAVNRSRNQARAVQGLANLQQIGQLIQSYVASNNGTYPIGFNTDTFDLPPVDSDWSLILNSYTSGGPNNYEAFGDFDPDNPDTTGPQILSIFRDPNAAFPNEGFLHYSAHPILMIDAAHTTNPAVDLVPYRLSRMRRPGEIILVMDGTQNPNHPTVRYSTFATALNIDNGSLYPNVPSKPTSERYIPYIDDNPATNNDPINPGLNTDGDDNLGNIRWRQLNDTAANFLFADGAARTQRPDQVRKRNIRVDR